MIHRLLLVVILAPILSFGQRGGGGYGGTMATNRIDVIAQMLSLSKEQKKQVKDTLDTSQKEAAPVRSQLVKGHQAIGQAIQVGKSQEEIQQLINAHAEQQSKMAEIELKAFAKIFQGLDESQQKNSRNLFLMMRGIFLEKDWNSLR
jgi:hypothetical protein